MRLPQPRSPAGAKSCAPGTWDTVPPRLRLGRPPLCSVGQHQTIHAGVQRLLDRPLVALAGVRRATGPRMPRRPWSDRSRGGAVGSEETIILHSNQPLVVAVPGTKSALLGKKRPLKPQGRLDPRPTAGGAPSPQRNFLQSESTADAEAAISCECRSTMSASVVGSMTARASFRKTGRPRNF